MTKLLIPTWWRKTHVVWLACAFALTPTIGILSCATGQSDSATTLSTDTERGTRSNTAPNPIPMGTSPAPDNTKTNEQDKGSNAPTADQQNNNEADLEIVAKIRRAIMEDKSLSTYAQNVKVIVESGIVTLRGPVRSADEKATVEQKAVSVVGQANVKNELEIKP